MPRNFGKYKRANQVMLECVCCMFSSKRLQFAKSWIHSAKISWWGNGDGITSWQHLLNDKYLKELLKSLTDNKPIIYLYINLAHKKKCSQLFNTTDVAEIF